MTSQGCCWLRRRATHPTHVQASAAHHQSHMSMKKFNSYAKEDKLNYAVENSINLLMSEYDTKRARIHLRCVWGGHVEKAPCGRWGSASCVCGGTRLGLNARRAAGTGAAGSDGDVGTCVGHGVTTRPAWSSNLQQGLPLHTPPPPQHQLTSQATV